MSQALNLAARPFVNRRPVVRLALLLWLAGALLLAGNVWLYWDFLAGRGDVHARRAEVEEAIVTEQRRIAALEDELSSYDLAAQNLQVEYLNQRIARRRFSWSRLFDQLAEVLPREARIQSLSPEVAGDRRRGRAQGRRELSGELDRVRLRIEAEARSDQAILELVDAFFADPDFEQPNLLQQAETPQGLIRFSLEVAYSAPETGGDAEVEVLPAEEDATEADPAPAARPAPLGRPASAPRELS